MSPYRHSGAGHRRLSCEGISTAKNARITTVTTSATGLGQLSQVTPPRRQSSEMRLETDTFENLRLAYP